MSSHTDNARLAIAQQAAEWFVTNRRDSLSAEDCAAFGTWLQESPMHIEEYLLTAAISRDLLSAVRGMGIDVETAVREAREDAGATVAPLVPRAPRVGAVPAPQQRSQHRRRTFAGLAAALLIAVGVQVWLQRDGQRYGLPRTFATAHGEQRSWLLPDGTRLDLNSDSAVSVLYGRAERLVRVERGQAFFQVAHETSRRFRVMSGNVGVIAIGTEFDVYRQRDATMVTVVEGKVAVYSGPAPAVEGAVLPAQATAVKAGERARLSGRSPAPVVTQANVAQAIAWTQHLIAFDQRPLGEVVDEFNRYNAVPIVVQGRRLAMLPISGVFRSSETESFVAFIARLDGVQVRREAGHIVVVDGDDGRPDGNR